MFLILSNMMMYWENDPACKRLVSLACWGKNPQKKKKTHQRTWNQNS